MAAQVCFSNNSRIRILTFSILLLLTPMSLANVGFTNTTLTLQEDSGTTSLQVDLVDNAGALGAVITRVSVDYAVSSGTATAGVDYTALSGTLVFTSSGSQTINLTILEDLDISPNETIVITLSNCIEDELDGPRTDVCGTFSGNFESDPGIFINSANSSETITIVDTTTPGALGFSSSTASVAEGQSVTLTVTRTGGSDGAVSINYATSAGDEVGPPSNLNLSAAPAESGTDFTPASGTLNWADGDTTPKTFTVTALSDTVVEEDDTFSVDLFNPVGGASFGNISSAIVTITDATNNGTISFSSSTVSVDEGETTTITVSRTGGSDGAISIDYATEDSTAVAGSDYTATSGTLSWGNGDLSDKSFTVTTLNDLDIEGDERFAVNLSNVSGGATVGTASGSTVTITDTTSPGTISISSTTASVTEGETTTITVSRADGSDGAVSIDYATEDGDAVAGSDYTATSGTLNWADGDSSDKSFTIAALADSVVDEGETLSVTLSNVSGGGILGTASNATITIVDSTEPGTISFSSTTASVVEGETTTISVSRTGGSDGDLSIDFTTEDGNAAAGSDYTATTGTLNWADGDTSDKSITIITLSDTEIDAGETFSVSLSNISEGGVLGSDSTATITIVDATTPGTISLNSTTASVVEGETTTITVSRTGGSDGAVSIDYATDDGTASAGSDYTGVSGTLNWADGDISDKSFTITALSDNDTDTNETLTATLSNISEGATLDTASTATITIVDDTTPGTISLSTTTTRVVEGEIATITVSRTGGSDGFVSIDYATADGDASAGSDYTAATGTLSWADDDVSDKTFTITTLSDTDTDTDETLTATLSNISEGATLDTASTATITIVDATTPGTISLSSTTSTVAEGKSITVTVSRTGGSDGAISVDYATSDSSATAGTDYTATSGTLNWADGDSSDKSFTLTGLIDNEIDEDETFSVTLSNLTGNGTLDPEPTATVTIAEATQRIGELEGLTPQQRSVANAIDEMCDGATGDVLAQCQDINTSDLSDDELIAIIDAITPAQISAQGSNAIDFGFQQLQTVHGRIVSLRQSSKSGERISLAGFTMNSFGQQIPIGQMAQTLLYNAMDEAGGDELLRDSPLGVFLKGQISLGGKDATSAEKGFDVDSKSITFGVDYQFTDQLVLGVASGYGHSNNDFDNGGGKMESNSGNFSIYGSYFLPEDFYVDMILSYAIHNYDNSRTISFPGVQTSATSNTFGDQYGGSLGFGKDFYLKSFFFSPYVRVEYLRTGIDEYTEQGGGIFALRVAEQSMFSLASTLGGQVNRAFSMPWGIISPGLRFEWRHQFKDDQRTIQSQFINAPAGAGFFSINTDDPDRDYFNLGASVAITLPEGRSAFLRYETRLGQNDITSHTIEAAIRIPF